MDEINVFWYRRDLRFFDNTGLYHALHDTKPVLPVFIFDTHILDKLVNREDARVHFIHQQLIGLNQEFKKYGSWLHVFHGTVNEAFGELMKAYKISKVYTNRDYEPYAKERDQRVSEDLKTHGVQLLTFKDQVIFEEGEILTDQGHPYQVFTPYKNKWIRQFNNQLTAPFPSENHLRNLYPCPFKEIPGLDAIGFRPSRLMFPDRQIDEGIISHYAERRDFPAVNGTSRIGIHLRHGTVSIRSMVKRARELSGMWLNELIWREFYMMIIAHFPHVADCSFKPAYDLIPWRNNEEEFDRWCKGKTGYPIVDAGMRELNATGYMHNRVRMIAASFLTKHLLADWRWGEGYFAQILLDYELASNNGGWQWAAGTGTDAQPYFRVFNPYTQAKKFDPELAYIRKWVPELNSFDYPGPVVDHDFARKRAIQVYKDALSGNN